MPSATFILIPGAGGSAWYWHLIAPKLKQLGHEAVPVELPAADDSAGLPEYTAAAIHAIGKREPSRIIVVAQSLGGFTAPLVCTQVPVALLVLVTHYDAAKRQQNRRDGRPADVPFDPLTEFFHDVPQPVIDAAWAQGEPQQSEVVFGSPCTFDTWPRVPTRVLIAREDRFFPAEFQSRVARERLGISGDEMPGGHLVALSQPDELTARLVGYSAAAGVSAA